MKTVIITCDTCGDVVDESDANEIVLGARRRTVCRPCLKAAKDLLDRANFKHFEPFQAAAKKSIAAERERIAKEDAERAEADAKAAESARAELVAVEAVAKEVDEAARLESVSVK